MTEIPEHLLKRSKSAKAAAGGGSAGDSAPADDAATAESSAGDAAPAPAAPAAPAAPSTATIPTEDLPNLDPEPPPAEPEPEFVTASKKRNRIPVWALPIVAALPVWAYTYAGTMQEPEVEDPLLVEGAAYYSSAGCAGCHGSTGSGGSSGYQLSDGSVLATFPDPIDHMVHVARGSAAIDGETYGADGRRVAGDLGQMPAQEGQIPQVELEMIVFHERAILSGEDQTTPGYEEWMDHMREEYEAGNEEEIDLEFLLACANPEVTPGATGEGSPEPEEQPCPGPHPPEEGGDEAAAG